tara:strand:- start:7630 stop:7917 length:288 start_codon:yes stop_codon:yes gene_type:complete
VVCGYYIALLIAAKYLTTAYIYAPQSPLLSVVIDARLFALVLAAVFSAAGGFIVNNFYDAGKMALIDPKSVFWKTHFTENSVFALFFVQCCSLYQ